MFTVVGLTGAGISCYLLFVMHSALQARPQPLVRSFQPVEV